MRSTRDLGGSQVSEWVRWCSHLIKIDPEVGVNQPVSYADDGRLGHLRVVAPDPQLPSPAGEITGTLLSSATGTIGRLRELRTFPTRSGKGAATADSGGVARACAERTRPDRSSRQGWGARRTSPSSKSRASPTWFASSLWMRLTLLVVATVYKTNRINRYWRTP